LVLQKEVPLPLGYALMPEMSFVDTSLAKRRSWKGGVVIFGYAVPTGVGRGLVADAAKPIQKLSLLASILDSGILRCVKSRGVFISQPGGGKRLYRFEDAAGTCEHSGIWQCR